MLILCTIFDVTIISMQKAPRLLEQFIPTNYNLTLDMHRIERTFEGRISITGISPTSSSDIKFHAKDLNITAVSVNGETTAFKYGNFDELSIEYSTTANENYVVSIIFSTTSGKN